MLGVTVATVTGWDICREEPKVSYLPRIIGLIGYDPFSGETTLGERLRVERRNGGSLSTNLPIGSGSAHVAFRSSKLVRR